MSTSDKIKLNGIASGATANTGTITKVQANGTDIASSGTANIPAASTSAYGVTKLSSSTSSTSTTLAATASAVKAAYDYADGAMAVANSAHGDAETALTWANTAIELAGGKEGKHTTTTVSLAVASWSSLAQTVSVSGVTTSNSVICTPAPASHDAYCKPGVYCSAQASGKLTFKCTTKPTAALTVNVMILGG